MFFGGKFQKLDRIEFACYSPTDFTRLKEHTESRDDAKKAIFWGVVFGFLGVFWEVDWGLFGWGWDRVLFLCERQYRRGADP